MKKKLLTSLYVFLSSLLFCQVGINTNNPQGILHVKNTSKKMGMVLPIVSSAEETVSPSGSTPVEATAVYDSLKQCLRIKTSNTWSDCMLDRSEVGNMINISVFGDRFWMISDYSSLTDNLMQKRFSYGHYSTAFTNLTDNNYLAGAGAKTYGLGLTPAGTNSPATRILAKSALTMNGSYYSKTIITHSGEIYTTGYNYGQKLGTGGIDGVLIEDWVKVTIPGLAVGETPVQIQQSTYNSIILTNLGNVYAAGQNVTGQTGLGITVGNTAFYTKIPTLKNIKSIWGEQDNTSYNMFTAIDTSGKVFAWGHNFYAGPFGATDSYISIPQDISLFFSSATAGGAKVKKVMIGYYALMALMDDGTIWGSVAQGFPLYRIGKGQGTSSMNNLILLSNSITLVAPNEKIIDFDIDFEGAVIITNKNVWYTGLSYIWRFGNGAADHTYNWTRLTSSLFDGKVTLTSLDLGYYGMIISTGGGNEGGSKLIVSGYNSAYKNLGTSPTTGEVQNSTFATY